MQHLTFLNWMYVPRMNAVDKYLKTCITVTIIAMGSYFMEIYVISVNVLPMAIDVLVVLKKSQTNIDWYHMILV